MLCFLESERPSRETVRHFGVGKLGMDTNASADISSDLQSRNGLGCVSAWIWWQLGVHSSGQRNFLPSPSLVVAGILRGPDNREMIC